MNNQGNYSIVFLPHRYCILKNMKGAALMKKSTTFFVIAIGILCTSVVFAQGWKKSLDTDFTLTQNTYSDSWAGGEAGSISWVWNANGVFEKQFTPKFNFKNTSKFSFGQTHIQDKETKEWAKPQKSTDLIDIENVGRFTLGAFVDPYAAFRIESQFLDASVEGINRYFTPLKLTESAGISKQFYKTEKDEAISRFGFAIRQIITQDIVTVNPDETETNTTNDGGFESVSDLKLTLSETLQFTSKLSLYKALFYSESDALKGLPNEDYWKVIDVNWENKLSATIVKYVTVSLYMQLLYDKEIALSGRFKETLAMGLTYKLF